MKVTIVGAGLGGLTLARVLYRNGVEVEIYETDPLAVHRGGTLRLHEETGHAALRAAGVLGHLPAIALDGGPARVVDEHAAEPPADGTGPVVDRSDLRDLLLASLPEDTVHWGERVVETRAGGEIVLTRGRVRATEALVGADGADSVVRHLLTDEKPTDGQPADVRPAGQRWVRVPGVTLIGAAAHLPSPVVADPANLAMRDGAELALAIADHPDDLEQALAAYEEKLFDRGTARPRAAANAV